MLYIVTSTTCCLVASALAVFIPGLDLLTEMQIYMWAAIGVYALYYVWHEKFQIRFKAVFVRKDRERFQVVHIMDFDKLKSEIRYKKKTYTVDLGDVVYVHDNKSFIFFDLNDGKRYSFSGNTEGLDPVVADLVLTGGAIKQFVAGLMAMGTAPLIMLVLVGVALGAVGYIVGNVLPMPGLHSVASSNSTGQVRP